MKGGDNAARLAASPVTRAFWLGALEVTPPEWSRVMGMNPSEG